MEITAITLIGLVIIGLLIWLIMNKRGEAGDTQGMVMMQQQLSELTKQLDSDLCRPSRRVNRSPRRQRGLKAIPACRQQTLQFNPTHIYCS